MAQTFKNDKRLQSILTAPTLTVQDKKQIVAEIQKTTGGQEKNETLKNFLNTLAENNRLSVLEGVCEKFAQLMSASRGEVEMTITSAAPLDSKIVKQLETAVGKSQLVGQGKKLKVVPKVCYGHPSGRPFDCINILLRSTRTSEVASSLRLATAPSISAYQEGWPG